MTEIKYHDMMIEHFLIKSHKNFAKVRNYLRTNHNKKKYTKYLELIQ